MGERLREAVITVCGAGYAPFASGSWGSLAAIAMFLPIWLLAGGTSLTTATVTLYILAPGVLLACCAAIAWGDWALKKFASSDPKPFVIDEFAGQWIALAYFPLSGAGWWDVAVVLGMQFFLFRVFDVLKPPPAAQLERLPGAWGVLFDDLAAGVYANVAGQMIWQLTPLPAWVGATTPA